MATNDTDETRDPQKNADRFSASRATGTDTHEHAPPPKTGFVVSQPNAKSQSSNTPTVKKGRGGILEFVRFWFTKLVVLILWLTVIGSVVSGAGAGYMLGRLACGEDYRVMGILISPLVSWLGGSIGLAVGVFTIILWGGLISTYLSIAENLQKIAQKMDILCDRDTHP